MPPRDPLDGDVAQVEPVGHGAGPRQGGLLHGGARFECDVDPGLQQVTEEVAEGPGHPHLDGAHLRHGEAALQDEHTRIARRRISVRQQVAAERLGVEPVDQGRRAGARRRPPPQASTPRAAPAPGRSSGGAGRAAGTRAGGRAFEILQLREATIPATPRPRRCRPGRPAPRRGAPAHRGPAGSDRRPAEIRDEEDERGRPNSRRAASISPSGLPAAHRAPASLPAIATAALRWRVAIKVRSLRMAASQPIRPKPSPIRVAEAASTAQSSPANAIRSPAPRYRMEAERSTSAQTRPAPAPRSGGHAPPRTGRAGWRAGRSASHPAD